MNIMIVDDHQMFIDGLKNILKDEKDITIIEEAYNGNSAFEIVKENNDIDLVITDINMPGISGTELTKKIKEYNPDIKVLVLTMHREREIIHEIVVSEAEGYILKNAGKQELLKALERIKDNGTYYSNEVLNILAENYVTRHKVEEATKNLSEREIEILKLVCQEYSSTDIAEMLFISPHTVDTHRRNILKKSNQKTIVGLIKFAINNEIIKI